MHALKLTAMAGLTAALTLGAMGAPAMTGQPTGDVTPPLAPGETETLARIEVVFVLDTTGSMSGLIDGAKAKIWAIANQIATAKPRPEIRMGLVGYRDRGDAYVTKVTDLTEDLDAVYADLMGFQAGGGGDGPESVNQALKEAVHEISWGERDEVATLRLIYLVGDAPPHMDYKQDTPYTDTCQAAVERGVIVNTIQCGSVAETATIWREIASSSEGEYFAIEQSGGVAVIETPFDAELASLNTQVRGTMLDYGDEEMRTYQAGKRRSAARIDGLAKPAAAADRSLYLNSGVGERSQLGRQELVSDVQAGRTALADVPDDELPESMRSMTPEERAAHVADLKAERDALVAKIHDLGRKRADYIKNERARLAALGEGADGFDVKVNESLRRQAGRVGIGFATGG